MKNITLAAKNNIYMIHDCKVWTVRGEPTQLLWQFRRRRWAQVTHPAPIWFWSWSWSWFLIHTLILILTSALILILLFYAHVFIQVGLSWAEQGRFCLNTCFSTLYLQGSHFKYEWSKVLTLMVIWGTLIFKMLSLKVCTTPLKLWPVQKVKSWRILYGEICLRKKLHPHLM